MRIIIKSNFRQLLEIYVIYLIKLLKLLNLEYAVIGLPKKRKVYTLLKSPHVNKKAKDQFEIKTYKKIIVLKACLPASSIKQLIKNKPPVIQIKLIQS